MVTGKSEESRNQEGFLPNKHLRWAKRYAFHCKVCYAKSHPENRDGVPPTSPTLFCKGYSGERTQARLNVGTSQSRWSHSQRWAIHPVLRGQKARGLTWRHSNQVLTSHIVLLEIITLTNLDRYLTTSSVLRKCVGLRTLENRTY